MATLERWYQCHQTKQASIIIARKFASSKYIMINRIKFYYPSNWEYQRLNKLFYKSKSISIELANFRKPMDMIVTNWVEYFLPHVCSEMLKLEWSLLDCMSLNISWYILLACPQHRICHYVCIFVRKLQPYEKFEAIGELRNRHDKMEKFV